MKNVTPEEDLYLATITMNNSMQLKMSILEGANEDIEGSIEKVKKEKSDLANDIEIQSQILEELKAKHKEKENEEIELESRKRRNKRRQRKLEKMQAINDENSDEDSVEDLAEKVKR